MKLLFFNMESFFLLLVNVDRGLEGKSSVTYTMNTAEAAAAS